MGEKVNSSLLKNLSEDQKNKKKILCLINVSHSYKKTKNDKSKVTVLKEVDLSIEKGKFVAIIGKSGSGKSTLLNLISGLEHIEKGEIYLENTNLTELKEKQITKVRKEKIGFIFQQYHLLTDLNVIENVMLPAMKNFNNKTSVEDKAKKLLDKVGLGDKCHRNIGELSGGEMQRVGIARALINDPTLLLADEPTGNLDTTNATEIFNFIYSLCKENNITVIMVTHNRKLSLKCDQIFYLNEGEIKKVNYSKKN